MSCFHQYNFLINYYQHNIIWEKHLHPGSICNMLGMKNFNFKYFHLINIALLGLFHLKITRSAAVVVTYMSFLVSLKLHQICEYI